MVLSHPPACLSAHLPRSRGCCLQAAGLADADLLDVRYEGEVRSRHIERDSRRVRGLPLPLSHRRLSPHPRQPSSSLSRCIRTQQKPLPARPPAPPPPPPSRPTCVVMNTFQVPHVLPYFIAVDENARALVIAIRGGRLNGMASSGKSLAMLSAASQAGSHIEVCLRIPPQAPCTAAMHTIPFFQACTSACIPQRCPLPNAAPCAPAACRLPVPG